MANHTADALKIFWPRRVFIFNASLREQTLREDEISSGKLGLSVGKTKRNLACEADLYLEPNNPRGRIQGLTHFGPA
jgi:hypothetical protein